MTGITNEFKINDVSKNQKLLENMIGIPLRPDVSTGVSRRKLKMKHRVIVGRI